MPDYRKIQDSDVLIPNDTAEKIEDERREEALEQTADELIGNTIGSRRGNADEDPLAAQNFAKKKINDLDEQQINALMDSSWIAEVIVDQFSEFATRSGAEVTVNENERIDDSLASEIQDSINTWLEEECIFSVLQRLVEKERESGEGYLLPITREVEDREWSDPLPRRPSSIEAFNVFGKHRIQQRELNDDLLSAGYNELDWIKVRTSDSSNSKTFETIHPSRFSALISRRMRSDTKGNEVGLSVFRRMINILKAVINAEWSVGQIIFSMVFKVLKTNLSDLDNDRQMKTANRMLENHYNALSLAMVGRDDELEVKGLGQGMGGAGEVFDFLKDLISAATKTPKTILFGNNAGTIAGSEQDETNYFSRISNFQGTYLTEQLRWIIDLGLRTREGIDLPMKRNGQLAVSPSDISYEVEWDKIFELTEKEKADLEKTKAETQKVKSQMLMSLVNLGGLNPSEAVQELELEDVEESAAVRAARESSADFSEELDAEASGEAVGDNVGQTALDV